MKFRPLWLVLGWCLVAAVVYLSVSHTSVAPNVENGDKIGHFVAYGTLSLWFVQLFRRPPQRFGACLALVALGVALECVQAVLPYRSFDRMDMLANACGVVLGWIAAPPRLPNLLAMVERAVRAPA
ncbi:MAG TPA: VanZ family protein [Burkholderiales bacterium]|nr:VanZ family protein [Burkholderiales bacterium]